MSSSQNKRTVFQFIFLLGTLAFTLSSLPGQGAAPEMTSSSSETAVTFNSTCTNDMLDHTNNAACDIYSDSTSGEYSHISGSVTVSPSKLSTRDGMGFKQDDGFLATLRTQCKGDEDCTETTSVIAVPLEEIKSIKSKIESAFRLDAKMIAQKMKNAKADRKAEVERKKQQEECYLDKDGNQISDKKDILQCRVEKVAKIPANKREKYYEELILPQLQEKLASVNQRDQVDGLKMLQKLKGSHPGDFINESIGDLVQYYQYNVQLAQMKNAIASTPYNDPSRTQMIQQLQQYKYQADNYFYQRGLQVPNESWLNNSVYDMSGALVDNLAAYRQSLDQQYAYILQQHQNMLALQQANNPNYRGANNQQTIDPRYNQSGQVATSAWPGQQQSMQQYSNGLPVPSTPQQRAATTSTVTNRASTAIPRAGSMVRSR